MGAPRMDPRPRFALFFVEPLEDRYLLSTLHLSHPNPATLSSQPGQSRQLAASASAGQQTTSTQERTEHPLASQPGSSSSATQVASLHPTIDLDGPGPDRDDARGTREGGPSFLQQQEAVGQYLSGSAGVTGLHEGDAAEPEETSAPTGVLQLSFDKLLAAGLSAGLAGAVTVLRVPAVSQETGVVLVSSEGEEENASQAAELLLLPTSAPAAIPDDPEPETTPALALGAPSAEQLPIDVEAIQRQVDSFFEQLAGLSEEGSDGQGLEKLTPWCMAATVAAWEWARWRRIRASSTSDAEDNGGPEGAAFLMGEGP